jgi:hypothetical protein
MTSMLPVVPAELWTMMCQPFGVWPVVDGFTPPSLLGELSVTTAAVPPLLKPPPVASCPAPQAIPADVLTPVPGTATLALLTVTLVAPLVPFVPLVPGVPGVPLLPFVPLVPLLPSRPRGPCWFQLIAFSPLEHSHHRPVDGRVGVSRGRRPRRR